MRILPLLLLCLLLSGCDRISQRVWNCGGKKLEVQKFNDAGSKISEAIPPRSWIGSMKGGVQITGIAVAAESKPRLLWEQGQPVLASRANTAEEVCSGRLNGIVVQQF